mgnify:CR=1 FL=1
MLALCFIVTVFEGYDLQSMGVAAPLLGKAMGLDKAQMSAALTAAMLGLMGGAASGGWLGDHLSRTMVLAIACGLFGLGTLATAFAWDLPSLVAFRALTGLGIGAALPNVMAILADSTSPERLGRQGTTIFIGFPVGAIAAAALLVVFPNLPWQGIFVVGGVPPILLMPFIWRVGTAAMRHRKANPVPLGKGVEEGPKDNFGALFGEGRLMTTLALWASTITVLTLLYLYLNWLPSLIVDRGFSVTFGSLVMGVFQIGSVIGALMLGRLVDSIGLRWPVTVAALLLALVTAWRAFADTQPSLLIAAALNGACVVGAQFVLYSVTPAYYPPKARGIGSGATVAAGRLGAVFGPLGFGLILAAGVDQTSAVLAMLPFILLAAFCLFLLGGRARALPTRETTV